MAKKNWFDFYGYIDIPKTFDWGNGSDKSVSGPTVLRCSWKSNRVFSIDKLTGADLSFGPFKIGISPTASSTVWAINKSQPPRAHGIWVWGPRYRHRPADGSVAERG
ncbi:hypothetical protein KCP73_05755 [Salmonella enterica subsp. enterica]|nr:hypothetical protein KCP73_05755 [Salmonella enterica subsp. enterica]